MRAASRGSCETVNPSLCEILAAPVSTAGLIDWLPFGKALIAVALGALLVMFAVLVFAVLIRKRRRRRRELDYPEWFKPKGARRTTDYLWEERYGKHTDY